jgi:hypothetical protein
LLKIFFSIRKSQHSRCKDPKWVPPGSSNKSDDSDFKSYLPSLATVYSPIGTEKNHFPLLKKAREKGDIIGIVAGKTG